MVVARAVDVMALLAQHRGICSATASKQQERQASLLGGHAMNGMNLGDALLTNAIATLARTAQHEAQLLLCRANLKTSRMFLGSEPWSVGHSCLFERRIFSLGLPLEGETMAFSELFLLLVAQRPLSYTTLGSTWASLGFTGSVLEAGRIL